MSRNLFKTAAFALVVCRHPDGRWLAVRETEGRGWWLPAGGVEAWETFEQAAHRETREEAGIRVALKGILRVEWSVSGSDSARMRVIFYAEPEDADELTPKSVPDEESEGAAWFTTAELEQLKLSVPGLRGTELLEWARYLEAGGFIAPLSVLTKESAGPPGRQAKQKFPKVPPAVSAAPADGAGAADSGGGSGEMVAAGGGVSRRRSGEDRPGAQLEEGMGSEQDNNRRRLL